MNPEMMNNMMNNIDPETMQNLMKNIDPKMIENLMKNMNPEMLSGLMGGGGANPEMLAGLMKNINPEMLSGLMANMNLNNMNNANQPMDTDQDANPTIDIDRKYKNGEKIFISNLKNDKYNNKFAIITGFNIEKNRYTVELEEDNSQISIKEDNCHCIDDIL